jgi:hypothetical protein
VTIPVGVARTAYTALRTLADDPREPERFRARYEAAAAAVSEAIYATGVARHVFYNGQYIGEDSSDGDTT